MRSKTDTKVTWILAVLFLLLLLSGVTLIAMISTVRRGKKVKADQPLLAQLNAAWGEPLPASLKLVQLAPPAPELPTIAKAPAFTIARTWMSDADALKLAQSGQAQKKGEGGPALSLDAEEARAFWYLLAPQLSPRVDEAWVFEDSPAGTLAPPLQAAVADWLAGGVPGTPTCFADPADHVVAGLTATLVNGQRLEVRPSPRRSVGPDLIALFTGAGERFGSINQAWLRVHRKDARRATFPTDGLELDASVSPEEEQLLGRIRAELAR
jgi:hypothetical protein